MYAIFDLLYLDGRSLIELPYEQRRARLEAARARRPRLASAGRAPGRGVAPARGHQGAGARGDDREAAGLPLRARTALRRLAEGQAHAAPGARDRRLDPRRGAALRADRRAADGLPRGRGASATPGGSGPASPSRRSTSWRQRLEPLPGGGSPFAAGPSFPRGTVFVEPCLVAEVEFREWTADGVMRAPSFKGLREDKAPREVVLEQIEPDAGPRPTRTGPTPDAPDAGPAPRPDPRRRCSTRSSGSRRARWPCWSTDGG